MKSLRIKTWDGRSQTMVEGDICPPVQARLMLWSGLTAEDEQKIYEDDKVEFLEPGNSGIPSVSHVRFNDKDACFYVEGQEGLGLSKFRFLKVIGNSHIGTLKKYVGVLPVAESQSESQGEIISEPPADGKTIFDK